MSSRHRSLVIPFLVLLLWHANVEATSGGTSERHISREPPRSSSSNPSVHKCCSPDQALVSGKGCIRSNSPPSAYLTHLQSIMSVRVGFPVPRGQTCEMMLLRRNVEHVATWWISRVGLLAVEAPQGELAIHNYCIDDLIDPATNTASPSAVTCVHELNGEVQLPLSMFRTKTVGKCCARDQHFSRVEQQCQVGSEGIPDWEVPVPGADNETQLGYTGFPTCQSGQYFTYYFNQKSEDHVRLAPKLSLIVVSMDGSCVEKESVVSLKDYCFDYEWDGSGEAKPLAVMCAPPQKPKQFPEKGPILVVFLSISCIALLLTMAFLVALQAKGIVVHHVPQSGPLAPRAHLTYVGTLFVGFMILAIAVRQDVEEGSSSCWATAGFLLFFLLSGFFWNTALCLESLLIIMRLGTPGWRRYLMHCVWAYGIPGIITIIALAMDANRATLPCGTITMRVGRFTCFISDPDAKMLFLYLPILVTLVTNLSLLGMGRHITNSRLRRLELGGLKHHRRHGSAGASNGKSSSSLEDGVHVPEQPRRLLSSSSNYRGSNNSIARFGLGTRETHALWLEAVCLAFWSGATWVMEIIGFAVTRYGYTGGENWYEYLWYIPTVVNSLRGLGVFMILVVLPKDSRSYSCELVSNIYERFGGRPLRSVLPSTRRSSTSTTTTATTTATASPMAAGDKERISLSSSDTQLSSHTASMSELHELPRPADVSETANGAGTVSTSLSTNPSLEKSTRNTTGRSSSDNRPSGKTNADLDNCKKQSIMRNSTGTLSESYPKKSSDGLPVKPPRKSIDLSTRAFLSVQNLSRPDGVENEKNTAPTSSPNTPPKTPSPSSCPKTEHEFSKKNGSAAEVVHPHPDSSPDTPPESPPPSPPTSPPPVVEDQTQESAQPLPETKNYSNTQDDSSVLSSSEVERTDMELPTQDEKGESVNKDGSSDDSEETPPEKDSKAKNVSQEEREIPQETESMSDEVPTSASSFRSRSPSPTTTKAPK